MDAIEGHKRPKNVLISPSKLTCARARWSHLEPARKTGKLPRIMSQLAKKLAASAGEAQRTRAATTTTI